MTNKQKWGTIAPLLIFGLLVAVLLVGLRGTGQDQQKFAQHVGEPAPALSLPLVGQAEARFDNAEWRGRPYVLNFFASWCQDCRAEHEELMTLAAAGLPMIGIAFKDKADRAAAYLDKYGNPFLAVAVDDNGRAGIDWAITGVPETYLIDGNGVIRWHHIGRLTATAATDELMPLWQAVRRGE
jgi:cytochrome c biogenesis protein CcmG/thiol:disulfide interchange protein DsbE